MSEQNFVISQKVQFAPFRSVGDFITHSRFELPAFNDLSKWNKRLVTNLLYFQTNYFLVFIMLFSLASVIYAQDIGLGLLAVGVTFGTFIFSFTQTPNIRNFRVSHPYIWLATIVIVAAYAISQLGSVLMLFYALCVPLLPIFIHASLRVRSIGAKINLELENFHFHDTVMAAILTTIGVELK